MTSIKHQGLALVGLVGLLGLAACSKPAPPVAFNTEADVHTLMVHVVDPASDHVWDSSGWVDTAEGTTDRLPKEDAGWKRAADSAAIVAEAGNSLMLPGRARDQGEWMTYARQMSLASTKAMKAAEAHNGQGLFDAGGEMYVACNLCHAKYLIQAK